MTKCFALTNLLKTKKRNKQNKKPHNPALCKTAKISGPEKKKVIEKTMALGWATVSARRSNADAEADLPRYLSVWHHGSLLSAVVTAQCGQRALLHTVIQGTKLLPCRGQPPSPCDLMQTRVNAERDGGGISTLNCLCLAGHSSSAHFPLANICYDFI